MKSLLIEMKDEKLKMGFVAKETQVLFQKRYRTIVTQGEMECPIIKKAEGKQGRTKKSKSRNLLERLRDFEEETLRFIRDPDVPFTNNQGENNI